MLYKFKGQGLAEYALILALISIFLLVALNFLGGAINNLFATGLHNQLANLQ